MRTVLRPRTARYTTASLSAWKDLAAGKKLMGENSCLIAMTHYPPVYPDKKPTAMSALFEKYNVSRVIFGHIHSMRGGWEPFELNGVKYILTAGDYIKFDPMLIYP